mmetsp:Transcript_7760/g.22501  ORF Transcript_7760/g.22501 Transcript_7760/m.22501 type:complete len:127 (+) Transcript_7760:55-435(+)
MMDDNDNNMDDIMTGLSRQPTDAGPSTTREFNKRGSKRYEEYARRRQHRDRKKESITQRWVQFKESNVAVNDNDNEHNGSDGGDATAARDGNPNEEWWAAKEGDGGGSTSARSRSGSSWITYICCV